MTHGEQPEVLQDGSVKLIYVGSLCRHIIRKIQYVHLSENPITERDEVPHDFEKKVTEILALLKTYKEFYLDQGFIPALKDRNEVNLFNTFCGYMDFSSVYPRKLVMHEDTRGNHYHTRKIERFTVIRGKAQIQLRKIGTEEVLNFYLDGQEPAYVDMPVWYTHICTYLSG